MKKIRLTPVATVALTLATSWSASAQALDGPVHLPRAQTLRGDSLNWSGYAVSAQQVTSVTGTFNVPTIEGPGLIGRLGTDVSAWVGIDGYTSGTVEQIGIAGGWDAAANQAFYYAWWEMYPRSAQIIKNMTISPGDSITASVESLGHGNFRLSIIDNSNGQSFTKTVPGPVGGQKSGELSSAEWVVERAATIYKGYLTILPLATFGNPGDPDDTGVTFSDASFTAGNLGSQTLHDAVSGLTEYPGDPGDGSIPPPPQPYWERMTMIGLDDGGNLIDLDKVSAVSGNSFTATFLANGTPLPLPGILRKK